MARLDKLPLAQRVLGWLWRVLDPDRDVSWAELRRRGIPKAELPPWHGVKAETHESRKCPGCGILIMGSAEKCSLCSKPQKPAAAVLPIRKSS